jgi:hypothetical protein
VIDPDVFQQLAADLDVKADVSNLDAREAERIGGLDVGFREGLAVAYSNAAAWIREILDNETTEGGSHG